MTRPSSFTVGSERLCTKCQRFVSLDAFHRMPTMRDGLSSWCRSCDVAKNREWRTRTRDQYNARRRNPLLPPRPCRGCGQAFASGIAEQVYCSVDCRVSWRSHSRAGPNRAHRRSMFERDGYHCYLCDRDIDRDRVWPDPLAATLDHVIPVSAGGTNRAANLRTAHWQCNREKGATEAPWWVAA